MKKILLRNRRAAGVALLLLLLGGCATKSLWERGSVSAFNEPAPETRLRLYQAPSRQDVLVVYEEFSERKASVRTRAYFLQENFRRMEQGHTPRFVAAEAARGLHPILFQSTATNVPSVSGAELTALVNTNGRTFSLWLNGERVGDHDLPVYDDGSGRVKRVLLTPATVVADATIVGGCLFLWAWSAGFLNSR